VVKKQRFIFLRHVLKGMCISDLIKKHLEEIQRFRKLLFPLIDFELISGFNIYEEGSKLSGRPIILTHLHSELDDIKIYRTALEDKIRKCCDTYQIKKIHYEKIDRHTAYRLREGWEADEYYDTTGRILTIEQVKDTLTAGGTVI
jgi:hypothetical protein